MLSASSAIAPIATPRRHRRPARRAWVRTAGATAAPSSAITGAVTAGYGQNQSTEVWTSQ